MSEHERTLFHWLVDFAAEQEWPVNPSNGENFYCPYCNGKFLTHDVDCPYARNMADARKLLETAP